MAIVFREGHLLLSVRYMVIIFQSIKRLYLAQLAACTKVKESDPPSSLWSRCILMKQMQRGLHAAFRNHREERYESSPPAPGSGSSGDTSTRSYALHQSLRVSSKLATTFCCPALFLLGRIFSERGLCPLVCGALCRCRKYKRQNKDCSVFSREKLLHIRVHHKLEKEVL